MYTYKCISDFVKLRGGGGGGSLSSNEFNESFIGFNPQIRATSIPACLSFARCS